MLALQQADDFPLDKLLNADGAFFLGPADFHFLNVFDGCHAVNFPLDLVLFVGHFAGLLQH